MKKLLAGMITSGFAGRFITGAGSIFNICGCRQIFKPGNSAADLLAIKSDWYAVGNELRRAAGYGR